MTDKVSRGVEPSVEVGVEKMLVDRCRCREGIEKQKYLTKNRSSIDPPNVEKLSRWEELARSIHQVLRCWQDYDKKKLRKLDRLLAIEKMPRRCRASFSKQFFKRRKT